jgi:hypothetical protein
MFAGSNLLRATRLFVRKIDCLFHYRHPNLPEPWVAGKLINYRSGKKIHQRWAFAADHSLIAISDLGRRRRIAAACWKLRILDKDSKIK